MESVIAEARRSGIPELWLNTEAMQSSIPFELKGWEREVSWGPFGIAAASTGVFADEYLAKGDICQSSKRDVNLIVLTSPKIYFSQPMLRLNILKIIIHARKKSTSVSTNS